MIRNPHLNTPGLPARKDKRVHHDWRQPAAGGAERAIDKLEDQLENAEDELATDIGRSASRLGCSHFFDAPDDPLSVAFVAYNDKIKQATRALRRALGVPLPPLDD
jgi:hypothetical protein